MNSVIYPPSIKTDCERLCALYPLIEQMRLEHNRVSEQASLDLNKYAGKFRTYSQESKARLKLLLAEQNRLKESIRPKNWSELTKGLSNEELINLDLSIFGDRSIEKVKKTEATSYLLDELKAINLDNMPEGLGDDPTEDFTTYTEVDPNSRISKTADRVTFTALTRNESAYLYKDKGVDHFDGNFEHLLQTYVGSTSADYSLCFVWGIANAINDLLAIKTASGSFLAFYVNDRPTSLVQIYLYECDSGTAYTDGYAAALNNTIYFMTIERDEDVGTYGTLYGWLCTGNYYGELGSTLIDEMSIALHTSKKDFRYIYGASAYKDGNTYAITGYMELLDLKEEGGNVYEVSCTDGVKLGDSDIANLIIGVSATDGLKGGDSPVGFAIMNSLAEDGAKLGDSAVAGLLYNVLVSDGAKFGESLSTLIELYPSLTDGLKLGEALSTLLHFYAVVTDGIKLGDSPVGGFEYNVSAEDGIKLGEALSLLRKVYVSLTDRVKLSDTALTNLVLQVLAEDGIKLGDGTSYTELGRFLKLAIVTSLYRKIKTITS